MHFERSARRARRAGCCLATLFLLTGAAAPSSSAESAGGSADSGRESSYRTLKHPVEFLEWGADLRAREEYFHNASTLQDSQPDSESFYLRVRPRVWASLLPATNVSLNARLIAEPRYYFSPESRQGWSNEEGLLDQLNLRVERLAGQPLALTLGRQDFTFGNKWLIWDGSTLDGSRTEYFDAARLTWDVAELATVIDGIYINQAAETDSWLPAINEQNEFIREQDERAGVVYLRNQSLAGTKLDGYLIYREQSAVTGSGNSGTTWTAGARVEGEAWKRWGYRAEAAPQWGRLNGAELKAFGFNGLVSYNLGGAWKHRVRAGYEYLSGDDPDTPEDEGWDPHWARRAQWSELMVQLYGAEYGRPGDFKNLQRPNVGWTFAPAGHLEWNVDYAPLFANENPSAGDPGYSADGRFMGHYLQSVLRFELAERWAGHLWGEVFWPGDYYSPDRQDTAIFLRLEVVYRF